jgi:hypothetical protein
LKRNLDVSVFVHEFNVRINTPNDTSDAACDNLENRVVFHGRGGVFILVDEVFEEGFDGVENCN